LPDGDYTLTASLPSTGTRYGAVDKKVQVSRNGDRIKLAAADIALPPTGIKGQITNAENQPIVMAKVQVKGTKKSTFSDSKGNYLLSGIEVSKVKCTVIFSAQGYQQCSKNIQLFQGKVKPFGVKLSLNKPK
jgi:hypothetical protein